jgi:SAM-dependent methyltransferase
MLNDYWKKYWNTMETDADWQTQVGRTREKRPIDATIFQQTVAWVSAQMRLSSADEVLDLCCGNGEWSLPLAQTVKRVAAVDFSAPLLAVLRERCRVARIDNVEIYPADVAVDFCGAANGSFSRIFLYFSVQYFSESQLIDIFAKARERLAPGGIFYLGDIPNRAKLWIFANRPEYVKAYFDGVKNSAPAIGNWFLPADLLKLGEYAGFAHGEIIEQPDWQINSRYRFDARFSK